MFVIRTPIGFVYKKLPDFVQVADDRTNAKQFPTPKAAQQFINRYSGGGYGLSGEDATVESAQGAPRFVGIIQ